MKHLRHPLIKSTLLTVVITCAVLIASIGNKATTESTPTVATGQRVISLASVNNLGADSGDDKSHKLAVSADGRFVAFASLASNLSGSVDANEAYDVFVRDRLSNTTQLISRRNSSNVAGNGPSGSLRLDSTIGISADGRYIVYESQASDLISSDNNGATDVFIYDRVAGVNSLVSSKSNDHLLPGNGHSFKPVISANGRVVVFLSTASDLSATDDGNSLMDICARDLDTGVTKLVTVNTGGTGAGDGQSSVGALPPSISDDGRFVAFDSEATNLVPNDTNGGGAFGTDVFVRDLQSNTTALASANSAGTGSGNLDSFASNVRISGNGRFAVFESRATDLVNGITDPNGGHDIFRRDLVSGVTSIVSVTLAGNAAGVNLSQFPAVSDDGRFVAFTSRASNLVATDTNNGLEGGGGIEDVFVRDMQSGLTKLVSINSAGTDSGNSSSGGPPQISADGRFVLFTSGATDLTTIPDLDNQNELFLRDLVTNSTTLITINRFGNAGGVLSPAELSQSDDSQVIAFESQSSLLVNTDTNGRADVFTSTAPPASLSVTDVTVTEGDSGTTNAVFTVTLANGPANTSVTAKALSFGGTAGPVDDFQPVTTDLVFNPGESSKTVVVPIVGDLIYEGTETFTLELRDVFNATVVDGVGIGTILDNELQPTLSVNDVTVNEGAPTATFTITLSGPSKFIVSFGFEVVNGTALDHEDFTAVGGGGLMAAGITTKTITVPIIDDTVTESDETFFLRLSTPVNTTIVDNEGIATIRDNETPNGTPTLQFNIREHTVSESSPSVQIVVSRSGLSSGVSSVDYKTIDNDPFLFNCSVPNGEAFGRCDFGSVVGTLTFSPGETTKTIEIPIIDDTYVESNERFFVELSNAVGATLGNPAFASVTITDNDQSAAPNPIFTSTFFVRQQYLDFLSREPEAAGLNAWLAVLNNCSNVNNDPSCDRLTVSAAFFGSQEFQLKGFYVFRFYKLGLNRLPQYPEIISDMSFVSGSTAQEVFQRKAQFAATFIQRSEFQNAFGSLSNSEYVAQLLNRYQLTSIATPDPANPDGTSKVTLTTTELVSGLNNNTLTRAQMLRAIADSDQVGSAEFNKAFVAMQYYGYLRRTPESGGYDAWLAYLNSHPTEFRTMVDGFMNSSEYRSRFGPTQ